LPAAHLPKASRRGTNPVWANSERIRRGITLPMELAMEVPCEPALEAFPACESGHSNLGSD